MYLVILFTKENVVEGVPESWVFEEDHKKYCYWPPKNDKVTAYVKRNEPPRDDWRRYRCIVKYTTNTYEELRVKVKEATNVTTECNSSDSDTPRKQILAKPVYNSEVEERSCSPVPPPPTKRRLLSYSGMVLFDMYYVY